MADEEHWLKRNSTTLIALLLIFILAMFLRSYWAYGAAVPDRLYSGGSDAFYYEWILRYNYLTGHQLTRDPLLNYPLGLTNPRPPMFNYWSYLTGWVISPAFPDPWSAITYSFIMSTAIFGALTIFPTYAIVKEAFDDRRAGLIAALLLAIAPGAIGGSVASDGDHDSFVLFFVVVSFFFYLKTLTNLPDKRWVESWRKPSSIKNGILQFFREGRTAVLYSMMAGLSVGTVALAWQGWAYAPVILLVYFVFQLFFLRIRNKDSMGLTITFGLTLGIALLISAPWYFEMNQVKVWFDVPAYLFAAAMALGILFTITRDYPWSLVVPSVLGVSSLALGVGVLFNPSLANAFVSGAGYFVQTKLYSTIAEAQAPPLSQIILSFGTATYFVSWIVLGYLLWQFVSGKRTQTAYLFFVVWSVAAIFMAQSAARFIFNAAPAFAATAGFGIAYLLVKRFDFDGMKRTYMSTASGSRRAAIRKAVKPRHVIGALLIVFMLFLNVWYAVDAGIPYEEKSTFDQQINNLLIVRPANYGSLTQGGSSFYLGAFGFSLPHNNEYYPTAWRWFATQDANVPESQRPAYLSWWDYGFEAEDRGFHPTVADNFQNGYNLAGNEISAQNESESIALLSIRLVEGDFWGHGQDFSPAVRTALTSFGINADSMLYAFRNQALLVPVVQANPQRYGYYDANLQPYNALYIYTSDLLMSRLDTNGQADLYRAIRGATGDSIRYFAVDSRLFPSSASNTGIFYAPMKLSDHRIDEGRDGRLIPVDFFKIFVTVSGTKTALENLGPYQNPDSAAGTIEYERMFYRSFFYRVYIGFEPKEVGATDDGIPGVSGSTSQSLVPLPGWGLSHWRVVYRTAYYNPFSDPQNHTSAWQAVNYFDALNIQQNISAGTTKGVVDLSPTAVVSQGVIFAKYYDDAYVNGTVTLPGGTPVPGVRVTVGDELGVPHYNATTDAEGRYSVLVPAGKITLTVSAGKMDPRTWIGASVLATQTLTITDDQAMRMPQGEGWLLTRNFVVPAGKLTGQVFLDVNGNSQFDAGTDVPAAGAVVVAQNAGLKVRNTRTADADGKYTLYDVPSGTTYYNVTWSGRTSAVAGSSLTAGDNTKDLPIGVLSVSGRVQDEAGSAIPGATVTVHDDTNGTTRVVTADSSGDYDVTRLLKGNFTVNASSGDRESIPAIATLGNRSIGGFNMTALPSGTLTGTTIVGGNLQPFTSVLFTDIGNRSLVRSITSDAAGHYRALLPAGRYSVTGRDYEEGRLFAALATVDVPRGSTTTFDPQFRDGVEIRGKAYVETALNISRAADLVIRSMNGDVYLGRTSNFGAYLAYLPEGTYDIGATLGLTAYYNRVTLDASTVLDLRMTSRVQYPGTVYRDVNGNGAMDSGEGLQGVRITVAGPSGGPITSFTGIGGGFALPLNASTPYTVDFSAPGYVPVTLGPATVPELRSSSAIRLTPTTVQVSGTLLLAGSPLTGATVPVVFLGVGGGAETADAVTDANGRYTASLPPGTYQVVVDENVSAGSAAMRWQNTGTDRLVLDVGSAPATFDIPIALKGHVTGTVTFLGNPVSSTVTFDGPEHSVVNAEAGVVDTYLPLGTYAAVANRTQGSQTFIAVAGVVVTGATGLSLALTLATQVSGRLTVNGASTTEAMTVTFERLQSGTFQVVSGTSGTYRIALPAGDYTVSIDDPLTLTIDNVARAYRIRFSGSLTVAAGETGATLDIAATRGYDNSTVGGRVTYGAVGVPATLRFSARNGPAMNATAATGADGTYSVALQPGEYNVHAVAAGATPAAFLGTFSISQGATTTLDLALVPSYAVTGVTTFRGGTRVSADITFTGVAAAYVRSDASGNYRIVLPPGAYVVTARTSAVENGMSVFYARVTSLSLASRPDPLNLALDRVAQRQVRVTWDASERQAIPAGASVTYTVTVRNTGSIADSYTFVGSPTTWRFSYEPSSVHLDFGNAGNSTTVTVTITSPADAAVTHDDVTIAAKSTTDAGIQGSATVKVDILPRRALALSVSSVTPTFDGTFLNYTVTITNKGNVNENVALVIPGINELAVRGWIARFSPPTGGSLITEIDNLTVNANATRTVTLVFESRGGGSGASAIVKVFAEDLQSLQATQQFLLELPVLVGTGRIGATGVNVVISEETPYPLFAVLVAVIACIVAGLVLSRGRRRK